MTTRAPRGRVLVLGLGRFGGGREATRFLARRGFAMRVADKAAPETLRDSMEALRDLDIDWRVPSEDPAVLDGIDLCVVNPAIPDDNALLRAARERGIPCTQEIALFLENYPGRVVLVTGTNGKSTTTTLLAQALRKAGIDTLVGGNLGHSLLADEERWSPDQCAVVEISSFQLERLDPRRHDVTGAVMTPVTRDHLDRHGSLENYRAAKAVAPALATGFYVFGADDAVAESFATKASQRLRHRRGPWQSGDAAHVEDGWLILDQGADPGPLCHVDALSLIGEFHHDNAMGAALAASALGADRAAIGFALATQKPLPFRLQLAGLRDGVRIYDNAVSTAIESTESALDSLRGTVHWVGGGKSKEGDAGYARCADALCKRVASASLFGAAAPRLSEDLRARGVRVTAHQQLEQALDAALAQARKGEALLFSPAFASFDQFTNFKARAERFHAWLGRKDQTSGSRSAAQD
ncbi:MAG: UDP-N-acetylmuramoyl-L-alanine--D-glutamate ligase [Planctomycetota bacterium]